VYKLVKDFGKQNARTCKRLIVLGGFLLGVLYFGGHNFLISNSCLTILNMSDVPRGGAQILSKRHKHQRPPLESGLP
jgi:hypothetical protein